MTELVRITGRALRLDRRSGSKLNDETGEQRPWAMDMVTVLVADQDTTDVTFFNELVEVGGIKTMQSRHPLPRRGQDVDWLVSVSVRQGRQNIEFLDEWAAAVAHGDETAVLAAVPSGGLASTDIAPAVAGSGDPGGRRRAGSESSAS